MTDKQVHCPSCGAAHGIFNPGVVTVACEYCGNAIYWDEDKLKNAGKQSILPEGFSRLYRGGTGKITGKGGFVVLGRIRYSFGKSFWDEWFLEFDDGSTGWLTEDNHEFALETQAKGGKAPAFSTLFPGFKFNVRKIPFVVEEVGLAECLGMEGELPMVVQSGETYSFADASSPNGRYTLGIEYDDEPPTIFFGKWLMYSDIRMDDEGLDW